MIDKKNDNMDMDMDTNIERNSEHSIGNSSILVQEELDEEILKKLGFEDGDIEMLEMLNNINATLGMTTIREEYMNSLIDEFGINGLEIEAIINADGDMIPGNNISKHNVANSVLTKIHNKIINTELDDDLGMNGGKRKRSRRRRYRKNGGKKKRSMRKKRRFHRV